MENSMKLNSTSKPFNKNFNMQYIYMLFTGCEVRMRKTVPEVLKTARARRARDVFKTEGTVFLIRTEAAGK